MQLPHLLFYGPPGTGKTSTILAVARELFGPELMKQRVLELNASHERGIDVIREKVKTFARVAVGTREVAAGYPCPPYKIIILDEVRAVLQTHWMDLTFFLELLQPKVRTQYQYHSCKKEICL